MRIKDVLKGCGVIFGYIIGVIGLCIGIMAISGEFLVSTKWFVLGGVVLFLLLVFGGIIVYNCIRIVKEGFVSPIINYENTSEGDMLFINYSKIFRVDSLVSIYIKKEQHRGVLGVGIVKYSKENEYTEIQLQKCFEPYKDDFEDIKVNSRKALEKTYAVPSISHNYVRLIDHEVSN